MQLAWYCAAARNSAHCFTEQFPVGIIGPQPPEAAAVAYPVKQWATAAEVLVVACRLLVLALEPLAKLIGCLPSPVCCPPPCNRSTPGLGGKQQVNQIRQAADLPVAWRNAAPGAIGETFGHFNFDASTAHYSRRLPLALDLPPKQ